MKKVFLTFILICFVAAYPSLAKCESILNLYQFSGQITSATGGEGTIAAGDSFYGSLYYVYDSNIATDGDGEYAQIDWIGGYKIHIGDYLVQDRYVAGYPWAKNVHGTADSISFYDGLDSSFTPSGYGPVDDLDISFSGTGVIDPTVYPYHLPEYFYATEGDFYMNCDYADVPAEITGHMDSITSSNLATSLGDPSSSNPVPEPSTMMLLGSGLIAGLSGWGKKRFKKRA